MVSLSPAALRLAYFVRLAPLQWWQMEFPAKSGKEGGVDWAAATNAFTRACLRAGIFDPARALGRGATTDGQHIVFHAGDRLIVDGVEKRGLDLPGSAQLYVPRPRVALVECPKDRHNFEDLVAVLGGWRWRNEHAAKLLAGWIAMAMIAGALDRRPHVWIIGERGSGKTAVLKLMAKLLGPCAIFVEGASTEAGIRQLLDGDSFPVLVDESEVRDERSAERVGRIVEQTRSAYSSSGQVAKGSVHGRARTTSVKSAFAFASISPALTEPADRSRFVVLPLREAPRGKAAADSREACERLIDSGFGQALLWRSIRLARVMSFSARTFADALGEAGHEPRVGDTLGTLAAGWWSLGSEQRVTAREARQVVKAWLGAIAHGAQPPTDAELALQYLLTRRVPISSSAETTISEVAAGMEGLPSGAERALALRGFKIVDEHGGRCLLVSTSMSGVAEHFRGSAWASTWQSVLLSVPNAQKPDRTVRFANHKSRFISVPLVP
ncbi:hypothetical protein [Methylopila sp. Yamaguchi]|uniref:hypothetical protein n=1 Tax=Methylopila sp. Yamaguchi TaxID=1437817 RepID=UPI000CBBFB4A|nr:hypothetical protein [Methylopila sp. Yamaguchi]GBD50245.1 DNA primase [Methylopila sp. Yamaguchi]